MKKSAQIIIFSLLVASSTSLVLAATSTAPASTAPASTTTTPTATNTSTQPTTNSNGTSTTTDPNSPNLADPAAFNPAILQGPSSGGTPVQTTTPTTETPIIPVEVTTTPTNTTPSTTVPPRKPPVRGSTTNVNPDVTPSVEETPTPAACPTIDPLSTNNIECPKVETVTIIPQLPIALLGTSILGLGLFWFILSYLNGAQLRSEKRFASRHLSTAHRQFVAQSKTQEYHHLLNFLTDSLTSKSEINVTSFQDLSAKIQLLGSKDMQDLVGQMNNSILKNDRKGLKPLVKQMTRQIKKES